MDINEHTTPEKLERYAFLWSEARLVLSAVTLLLGALSGYAMPLAVKLPGSSSLGSLSTLFWIISGLASLYLLYVWYKSGRKVFGGDDKRDMAAFFISIVFGLNLGLTGVTSNNIVLSILYGFPQALVVLAYIVGAAVYLWAAWHLWNQWKKHGEKLFGGSGAVSPAPKPVTPPSPGTTV